MNMKSKFILIFILQCVAGHAAVLDWTNVTWTAGSLTNSYDVDATNPGNDITVGIGGTTAAFSGGTPLIDSTLPGGTNPADQSLRMQVDFANTAAQVTVTISFNYPALIDGVSFKIFDIGRSGSNHQDQIRSILGSDGTTDYAATITNVGSAMQLAGTGLSQTLTGISNAPPSGNGSSQGTATIGFGTNKINKVSFVYGNGPSTDVNPTAQQITLHDISFNAPVVPEVGAGIGAICLCVALGLFERRRQQRVPLPTS